MHGSKQYLHPEAVQRLARMDIRAKVIVEGFLSGIHRSPYFGQSLEFIQHRPYVRGDDLRRIDWKVWGRHDRLVIKQYEEDANLRATLLVDVSNSMRYGRGPLRKYDYGATLAVSLAYLLLGQQDAVGCIAFDAAQRAKVEPRAARGHLQAIIQALEVAEPADKTDLAPLLQAAAEQLPRRGLIVLISDLFVERAGLFRGLGMLRQRGHEVLLFHILDDDELEFPFDGPTRFEGLETADLLRCNPRALRQGYLEALQAYLEEIRQGCSRTGVDYTLVRTSQPFDTSLAAMLAVRARGRAR
ncbi:MAG: DUF58 domain-containing protein [Planctomycetes bacterium]|nr:DUF58 domain-containing protein [Planctomycetota bacterium]